MNVHFIGIGGIGMSGLAKLLLEKQVAVTGSDLARSAITESLEHQGAKIYFGQKGENVSPGSTVVYNTSIKESNPEYVASKELKCKLLHRSDLLLQLTEGYETLSVAGTHGKTTTSSLLAHVLVEGELDPAFAVGGIVGNFGSNARHGSGKYFVAEADESDGTFLKYNTFGGILTNCGLDHMDTYGSEEGLKKAFQQFINGVRSPDHFFWCGDDARLETLETKGISYGFDPSCRLQATNVRQKGWKTLFDAHFGGRNYFDIEVALPGMHQALNALAVFGLALCLGVEEGKIRQALSSFQGVKRRCEKRREEQGILFLDDYAHHPTEIKTTLEGIKKAIGERRLIAVFQPHRYTRTRDCLEDFSEALAVADKVIVTDIFAAGEEPIPGISPEKIKGHYVKKEGLPSYLGDILRPHDVLVTLGAGDITKLIPEIPLSKKTLKVGVVFGGRSLEHDISLKSAEHVRNSLGPLYEMHPFFIDQEGNWDNGERLSSETLKRLLDCDIVFPVLHGKYGEDGTIQGFFEMLNLPYVGCGHTSSALCMDKALLKHLILQHNIQTSPFVDFSYAEWKEGVEIPLAYPVFVKGVHLGSALSIQKVEKQEDLAKAVEEAFTYDTHVLVEEGLNVREIEFAVLGNENPTVFPPGEVVAEGKVYSFENKYLNDSIRIDAQADLSPKQLQEGMKLAKRAYRIARCAGLARVDFFLDQAGKFWFNEINPIPGFTEISLYPKICSANGLQAKELMDQLIILGLSEHRKKHE